MSILTSPDSITWTAQTSGTASNLNTITFYNGNYVVAGNSNTVLTSSNGITWTARASNISATTAINWNKIITY